MLIRKSQGKGLRIYKDLTKWLSENLRADIHKEGQ
jgi:hypothetical protein